jgi:hypothetical protein
MIDPAKVMHKIDNDDFAINFRDAFISNEHVKLLREIFKNVDYKNLDETIALWQSWKQSSHVSRHIKDLAQSLAS